MRAFPGRVAAACLALAAGVVSSSLAAESVVLANGLKVVVSRDSSAPVVAVVMGFNAGSRNETRDRAGFAHLFEKLMFEGSKHARKGEYDRILESYGGDNNAFARGDFTLFHEVLPAKALPVALWLDADRLADLDLRKDSVRGQVEVAMEERRMRVDNAPYGRLLHVEIASHAFSNWQNSHPIIADEADYDAATHKAAEKYYSDYYSPANAVLAIVGDVEPQAALDLARQYFEWIPNQGTVPRIDVSEPEPGPSRWVKLSDSHARLPAFAVSWKGMPGRGTREAAALTLVGRALFQGKSSRLYQELVKASQASVSVAGGLGFPLVEDPFQYNAPGAFGGWTVHKAGFTAEQVKDLVMKQVAKVAASGLDAAELVRLKTVLRSEWIKGRETCLGRAQALVTAALLDGDPASADAELSRFMAVTPADTKAAAQRYLRPEIALFFSVGPGGGK
ncbi:MAG: insulinase family protein [Elusimicrobia bacterium]|nr:insulinase family protein [Elusimicrobiota bacterium]